MGGSTFLVSVKLFWQQPKPTRSQRHSHGWSLWRSCRRQLVAFDESPCTCLFQHGKKIRAIGAGRPLLKVAFGAQRGQFLGHGDVDELIEHGAVNAVSYTHLRAHETVLDLVCRLLLEKKKTQTKYESISLVRSLCVEKR